VCRLDYPFTLSHAGRTRDVGGRRLVSTPSPARRGLARDRHHPLGRKGSPTLTPVHPPVSGRGSHRESAALPTELCARVSIVFDPRTVGHRALVRLAIS